MKKFVFILLFSSLSHAQPKALLYADKNMQDWFVTLMLLETKEVKLTSYNPYFGILEKSYPLLPEASLQNVLFPTDCLEQIYFHPQHHVYFAGDVQSLGPQKYFFGIVWGVERHNRKSFSCHIRPSEDSQKTYDPVLTLNEFEVVYDKRIEGVDGL